MMTEEKETGPPQAGGSSTTEPDEELAAEGGGGGGWYSWGNAWLQDAKSKTLSTLELVKKDLSEFTDAVSQQATATVGVIKDKTTSVDAATAGGWVKSLVGSVSSVLYVEDTTKGEENDEIPIVVDDNASPRSRLFAIQSDVGTYTGDPAGAPELFEDWLDHFNLEGKKSEIRDLLSSNSNVRKIYADLVPQKMSNSLFWQRYFYKVHQFTLDQARREALLKRSDKKSSQDVERKNSRDSWGDEDSDLENLDEKIGLSKDDKHLLYNVSGITTEDLDANTVVVNAEAKTLTVDVAGKLTGKRNSGSSDSWTSDIVDKEQQPPAQQTSPNKLEDVDATSESSYCLVSKKPTTECQNSAQSAAEQVEEISSEGEK